MVQVERRVLLGRSGPERHGEPEGRSVPEGRSETEGRSDQFKGWTLVTDGNGDFRLEGLCAGEYWLVVTHAGYDTVIRHLVLRKNEHTDIDLVPGAAALEEVTVTGQRKVAAGGWRQELSGRELEASLGGNLAEALSRINGVSMLQTGSTIAKPVIHGLHSNRVLIINNGIRQEGQQWGNEHAPEIDPFIAGKLTVVKGVEELRYGSDAIGGVVLVEPRALLSAPGYRAGLHTQYATNNRQLLVSGSWEEQLKKFPTWTYRVQGTFRKAATIATPGYRLNNTALEEKSGSLTATYRKEHFQSEWYYSFYQSQVGIFTGSHIGNLTDLEAAIKADSPAPTFTGQDSYRIGRPYQDIVHHLMKSRNRIDKGNSRFNIILAGQYNNRREYDLVRNAADKGSQLDLEIVTLSEEINWEHPRVKEFSGTVGVVAMQQENSYSGRYLIPNYTSFSYGGYAIEKWAKGRWNLQGGLRVDRKQIDTRRLRAGTDTLYEYEFDYSTLAGAFNLGFQVLPQWQASTAMSLSTRAPHVNELLTDGIHHGTGTYEKGNIGLRPEQSFRLSLSNRFTSSDDKLQIEWSAYRNQIRHYIYQQPRPDDPVLTIRGAFPLVEYEQTDALLQGIDLSARVQPWEQVAYRFQYALLRARDRRTNDWLIWMPADRITNEVIYTLKNGKLFMDTYFSVETQQVMRQKRVPDESGGRQDYKVPPPGYFLLNADVSTSLRWGKLPLTIGVSARNLLNRSYREYLNMFRYYTDEMGRNIQFKLKLDLQYLYE